MDRLSDLRRQTSGTAGRGHTGSGGAARDGGGGALTGRPGCCGGALWAAETLQAGCPSLCRSLAGALR